jgi:hypothetical protein
VAGSRILVLNAGSSSLKAALIESPDHTVARATVPWSADVSRTSDRAAGLSTALIELGLRRGCAGVSGLVAGG